MERHEIRIAPWKIALLVVSLIAFTLTGFAMLVFADAWMEKAAGVLCVGFFGGFGAVALHRRSKGQGRLAVLDTGLEIAMFGPRLRLIPWADIESIGTLELAKQKFTSVRLRNYRALLGDLSEEEATRALKDFGALRSLSYATIAVGAANGELKSAADLMDFAGGSRRVKSVAELLGHVRDKYGAEIMLSWIQRDRPAPEFAKYLNENRLKNSPVAPLSRPQKGT